MNQQGPGLWDARDASGRGYRVGFLCYLELNFGSVEPHLLTVPNLKATNQAMGPQSRCLT